MRVKQTMHLDKEVDERPKSTHIHRCVTPPTCKCMQIHSTPDVDLNPRRRKKPKIRTFQPPGAFADDRNRSHFFLIKMQMWGIKFACWTELIPRHPVCLCCNHKLQTGI